MLETINVRSEAIIEKTFAEIETLLADNMTDEIYFKILVRVISLIAVIRLLTPYYIKDLDMSTATYEDVSIDLFGRFLNTDI